MHIDVLKALDIHLIYSNSFIKEAIVTEKQQPSVNRKVAKQGDRTEGHNTWKKGWTENTNLNWFQIYPGCVHVLTWTIDIRESAPTCYVSYSGVAWSSAQLVWLVIALSVAISNHTKGICCLFEKETLPSLLSTGWFQERTRELFPYSNKINYERLTFV